MWLTKIDTVGYVELPSFQKGVIAQFDSEAKNEKKGYITRCVYTMIKKAKMFGSISVIIHLSRCRLTESIPIVYYYTHFTDFFLDGVLIY